MPHQTGPRISIPADEIEMTAVRAQGAGGQNVNKVSNAVHLRFDVKQSSLPDAIKSRLLELRDRRITQDGVILIKAQRHRSLEHNRADALERLDALVAQVAEPPKLRRPTRPTAGARRRRLELKTRRSQLKSQRGKVED